MKRWFAVLAAAVLALLAAQQFGVFTFPTQCDKCIDVSVVQVGGGNLMIVVPNLTKVPKAQGVVKWRLITPKYKFPTNGIEFDPNGVLTGCTKGDPAKAFHNGGPKEQDQQFHWNRKPNVFEDDACYKYIVRVKAADGGIDPPPLDPWIKNEP